MGAKNLKGIVIQGDGSFDLPEDKAYARLFQDVYKKLTETAMMDKYHNLGTPVGEGSLCPFGDRLCDPGAGPSRGAGTDRLGTAQATETTAAKEEAGEPGEGKEVRHEHWDPERDA